MLTIRDQLQKKYTLILMDDLVLERANIDLGSIANSPTILYSIENIEFFENRNIKKVKDLVRSHDKICVLAHGVNQNFPFRFINHFDFWIEIKKLNNSVKAIHHTTSKPKDFLFLTRRESPLRNRLRDYLLESGCLDNSVYSYQKDNGESKNLDDQYEHPSFHNLDFKKNHCHHEPAIWQLVPQQYISTKYSIVAETCESNNVYCLSEKIFKPMIAGHIFIVLAGAGYLKYLRQCGFKTFHDYIDESYDLEIDPIKRIKKIVSCCEDLASRDHIKLYRQVSNITKHNRELFFNEQHLQRLNMDILRKVEKHLQNAETSKTTL